LHDIDVVIDDRLLRVGSSNLNDRSMGFDRECDLAIEADANTPEHEDVCRKITSVRDELVSEHLGVSVGEFERVMLRQGGFLKAIEALHGQGKTLRPFTGRTVAGEESPLAENDLMDLDHVPRSLTRSVQRWIEGLLLDTLIVRSLLMPSIATLLGRWFWWPQVVYPGGDHDRPQPPTHDTADRDDIDDTDALTLPTPR
jgi:hypothetical protein